MLIALALLLGSLAQRAYRLTLPTDGWSFEMGTIGSDTQDHPHYLENLIGAPTPLQPGDWLLAVDGHPLADLTHAALHFQAPADIQWQAGQQTHYTVLRGGAPLALDVPLYHWPVALMARALGLSPEVWAALLLAAMGSFVFLNRPREWAARALLMFSVCLSAALLSSAVVDWSLPEVLAPGLFPIVAF